MFDSGFMLGDGVWEGFASTRAGSPSSTAISTALFEGAKAIAMDIGLSREALTRRLYETLDANGMDRGRPYPADGYARIRSTPYQDPRMVISPAPPSSSSRNIRRRFR